MNARLKSPSGTKPTPTPAAEPASRRRILLVDDHPMIRAGLAQLINKQADLQVCGEAAHPSGALEEIARCQPDLLVTDLTMPGRGGIEFLKDVLAMHPELAILVISMHDETIYAERVLRCGARGYMMKGAESDQVLTAIRQVLSGQVYVSGSLTTHLVGNLAGPRPRGSCSPIEKLTDREFEVFQLIGRGRGTREIAGELHISPKTVEVHRGNIKAKLGLGNATTLVRHAVRWMETQDLQV